METVHDPQKAESAVIEVIGEPAIIINGVPNLTCDSSVHEPMHNASNAESEGDPCFAEWLEGRKVSKLFGDQYYPGKVVKYDRETNWYRVVYEDGDLEDLEWHELEEVLLPLDISIPLKNLALQRCKCENSARDSGFNIGRSKKSQTKGEGTVEKAPKLPQASKRSIVSTQKRKQSGEEF